MLQSSRFFGFFVGFLGFSQVFWDFRRFFGIFAGFLGFSQVFWDSSNTRGSIQINPKQPQIDPNHPNIAKTNRF